MHFLHVVYTSWVDKEEDKEVEDQSALSLSHTSLVDTFLYQGVMGVKLILGKGWWSI